jgi:VanZ family protein
MIEWFEKNKGVSFAITLWIAFTIFYISSLEITPSPGLNVNLFSTIYHMTAFFFLAIFLFVSLLNRKWDSKKIIFSLILLSLYAILDELHQHFIPGRVTSFSDFLLDFNGIAFASLIYFILILKKR